jgi:hypothetical protein
MRESRDQFGHSRLWLRAWLTAALALGAGTLIPWILMALEREDVEASESTLMLAVARQLTDGPAGLYGPYGGRNPLVLIHAPFYYRLAALCAWPMARAGLDAEAAARVAGRSISMAGFVAMLAGAFILARSQGAPRIAGWWAALLAAATPVYGGLPFEVRPDLFGLALQTWGIVLVLGGLVSDPPHTRKTLLAFACFALAGCTKQHMVVAPGVSMLLLMGAWARGRLGWKTIVGALLVELVILLSYYGLEEYATAGRMSRSVFVAAREASVIHASTWQDAGRFMLVLCWKCVGIILLLAASSLAAVTATAGRRRTLFAAAGGALIGIVAALTIGQIFAATAGISNLIVLGLAVIMVCFAPCCAAALLRAWRTGGIDPALALYLAGELAMTAFLVRQSTGAWYNYAVEGVLFASILAARALARAVLRPLRARAVLAAALAVLAVPAFALTDVKEIIARRRAESGLTRRLFERMDEKPDTIFFVDRPGLNRVHARADLVYDPWLYPVFEYVGIAEPRSIWLARALESGPIRVIVTTAPQTRIEGIPAGLPELGYALRLRIGPWLVWTRRLSPSDTAL